MSRPALLTWLVAAAVAAFPTWEEWRFRLQPGAYETFGCVGGWGGWETPLLDPLRGDLDRIMENVEAWGLPAVVVLVGFLACLGGRDPRVVGRRTAGVLVAIAVLVPVVPVYAAEEGCGLMPILSAEWFATVMSSWGSTQLCLLAAATLVLLTTRMMSATTSVVPSAGVTWRRPVALLVDYMIIVVTLTFVIQPILSVISFDTSIHLDFGILSWSALSLDKAEPERLLTLAGVFLYFWVNHSLWGRTPGKRLLRIHLVSVQPTARPTAGKTALRTLLFPLLLFEPTYGQLALIVDGLWALLDPDGRTLHDRLANTDVTRRIPPDVGRSDSPAITEGAPSPGA
ncbi:RDD family protein [Acrocarpospora pleiomorpha]|uniref:RDD family protein n=1 Tax=Acrocarpospora pleiomorpha TaxID=90975 RepID=UPI0012D2BF59|nr:RDD family protein [Acrocarpospora pleiomorpha]